MNAGQDAEIKALVKRAIEEGAGQPGKFTFWDLTDDGLARVRREYERMIEDRAFGTYSEKVLLGWLAQVRLVRMVRWCLKMRYGAVDEHRGTKSFDRWYRFGEAPAYSLARGIDIYRWQVRERVQLRGLNGPIINWSLFQQEAPAESSGVSAVTA